MSDVFDIPMDAPSREEVAYRKWLSEQLQAAFTRITWQWCLGHSIAIAGGLCASFSAGFDAGNGPRPPFWTPGCGRRGGTPQPNLYPCGCSKHKVNAGRCDSYKPGELP